MASTTSVPTPVQAYPIDSDRLHLEVLDFGAHLARVDLDGVSLCLGLPRPEDYPDRDRNPYYGAVVGRYANRIANGRFELDGIHHELDVNEGSHHLHGGAGGFTWRRWEVADFSASSITLDLISAAGDQGYPGRLDVRVRYGVTGSRLSIDFAAETDAPTIVNLTTHSYWNLSGIGAAATVHDHVLTVDADTVVEVGDGLIPTGRLLPVVGTTFDLRSGTRVGDCLGDVPGTGGFDHCFVPAGVGLRRVARLEHPPSARTMEIHSDQPGLQVYTAGLHEPANVAVCLEPQRLPDAPNQPDFPSAVLRPGERYEHRTEIHFT